MDVPLVHKMDLRNVNSRQARAPAPGARRTIRNSVRRGADLTPQQGGGAQTQEDRTAGNRVPHRVRKPA